MNYTELNIPSKPCQVSKLDDYVRQIMTSCKLREELYANILISLTEAVNNAIIHGNKNDASKQVSIKYFHKQNEVVIKVKDEGKGFNIKEVKDPRSEDRIACCGGRGVLIMKELCDSVKYQNNGNTVQIHFKISE